MNDATKTPEVSLTPATDLIRALERIRLYGNAAERYEGWRITIRY